MKALKAGKSMEQGDGREIGAWKTWAGIGVAVVLISLLHYLTNLQFHSLHSIFQRLYYVPIIFAALTFGLRSGVATALACTLAYIPHVVFQWGMHGMMFADQVSDMIMFNIVGALTGVLSDMERRMKNRYRDAYNRLQDSFDKAQQSAKLAAMGRLASAVAHEIRNPLNGIKGAQDILFERIPADDPQRKFVDIVRRETVRLDDIVTEFLDFARPREPHRMNTNLCHVVESVISITGRQAVERGVTLRAAGEGTVTAHVDADQIKQVLLNLALNAIDACGPGGAVEIGCCMEDGGAVIFVSDNGPGIADEYRDHLFEPFYTTKPSGTGLGLAVSLRIVENHEGEITVKSEPGRGTTFEVRLGSGGSDG